MQEKQKKPMEKPATAAGFGFEDGSSGDPQSVNVGCRPYNENLPVAGLTVGQIRRKFKTRLEIGDEAVPVVNGTDGTEDTVCSAGCKLQFIHKSGEKGMSYCRFGWDGSDVYVFESSAGLECCACSLQNTFTTSLPEEMIKHLAVHRRAGQYVPHNAILALWEAIPGAQRPVNPEPALMSLAHIMVAQVELELTSKKLEARALELKQQEQKENNDTPPSDQ